MLGRLRFAVMAVLCILLASCRQDTWPLNLPEEEEEIAGQSRGDGEKTGDDGEEQAGSGDPSDPAEPVEDLPVNTGLPVLFINTENSRRISDKTTWVNATVRILTEEGRLSLAEATCQIRGRGNSTWNWSKKPYALKLGEKLSVLGMAPQKHWVLLANYMDRTLMRDALGFHVSRQTSLAWTPSCRYVELILNGEHIGNYLLAEQVRPDENRVPVAKGKEGSFLFESDFHFDEAWQWRERNIPFNVRYPEEDSMDNTLFARAQSFIKEKLNACWSGDYGKASAALDLQSFADYWIVFELMGNHELRNPGSVFTYTSEGGKWTAGPVWDFDWGGLSYYTSPQARTGLVNRNAVWYEGLHGIKKYRQQLADRWKTLKPGLEKCVDFIEETRELLRESDKLNRAMWDPAGAGNINGDEQLSFDAAVDRLKANYLERIKVIDSIIADGEF